MDPQSQTLELLRWIQERGLAPPHPQGSDRCVCPITKRITTYDRLHPHQRRNALWIPTAQGMRDNGIEVEVEDLGELTVTRSNRFLGAGVGESEAMLSLLNRVRYAQAS